MWPTGTIVTWALGTLAAVGVVSSSSPGEVAARARAAAAADRASDATPLEGTRWTVVELDGVLVDTDGPHEAYLMFDGEAGRLAGSGGCNRLTGGYERHGDRLRIQPLAATRRACLQGMETEASLMAALERVRRFRIDEERLTLIDLAGRVLAVLEARGRAG